MDSVLSQKVGIKEVELLTNFRYFDLLSLYLLDGSKTQDSNYGGGYPLLAVGDLNRDGYADLVFGFMTWNNSYSSYTSAKQFAKAKLLIAFYDAITTAYTFDPEATASLPTMYWTQQVVIGDFNADGYSDIFAPGTGPDQGDPRGEMPILGLGSPSGFVDASDSLPRFNVYTHQSLVADFNEDGKSDFLLLNNGWISNSTATSLASEIGGSYPYLTSSTLSLSNAVGWQLGSINSGSLGFLSTDENISNSYASATACDYNGDGHADIVLSGGNFGSLAYKVMFLKGNGKGELSEDGWVTAKPFGDVSVGASLTGHDFDGDGRDEVMLISTKHNGQAVPWNGAIIQIFKQDSTSSAWIEVTENYVPTVDISNDEWGGWIKNVYFSDVDLDGDEDMVLSSLQGPDDHHSGHIMPRIFVNKNGYFTPQTLIDQTYIDGLGGLTPIQTTSGIELVGASNWIGPSGLNIYRATLTFTERELGESLTGTTHSDRIWGLGGNDSIVASGGDDWIDGGPGTDTAILTGISSNYNLQISSTGIELKDTVGTSGTDALLNIENLQFADKTIIVESKTHDSYASLPTELYQFFITAFNAAPGVSYMDQLVDAYKYGLSVKQIVDIFTTKSQFTSVYPTSLSHQDLATQLVANIVKTSATDLVKAQAVTDIKAALDYGLTVGDVIFNVFGNLAKKSLTDASWGNTAKQFNNQITVAKYYTDTLSQSTTDLETLKDVIQSVTATTDVSTDAVVASLIGVALLNGGVV